MTPKQKAKELVDKYINLYPSYIVMFQGDIDEATKNIKQGALIAVDEIIKALRKDLAIFELGKGFWQDVKKEIEQL